MWSVWLVAWAHAQQGPHLEHGARAHTVASALIETVGERPAGTEQAERAQAWVASELTRRGWPATRMKTRYSAVIGCVRGQSDEVVLFVAHTDSVPGTVGANDNAAAVGVLLTAAERLVGRVMPRTVCLAFPDAEEIGLRGSIAMAQALPHRLLPGELNQVVSLDLVGRGRLTHNGLGPAFGARRLRALLAAAPADVPWVYRGVSHAFPGMERSDHAPFAALGIPASHLMARGESGVDWAYHRSWDTLDRLQEPTLQQAVDAVLGIASAPGLPAEQTHEPAFVLPWLGWVVPGWLTWLGMGGSGAFVVWSLVGLPGKLKLDGVMRVMALWSVAALVSGAAMMLAVAGRRMDLALAGPAVCAGILAWSALVSGWRWMPPPEVFRGIAVVVPALGAVAFLWVGAPLLALPFAVSAAGVGLSRWSRALGCVLAAWPVAWLLQPATIRELDFHHLFAASPMLWAGVAALGLLPVTATLLADHTAPRGRYTRWLVAAAMLAVVWGWMTPEQVAPYIDRP